MWSSTRREMSGVWRIMRAIASYGRRKRFKGEAALNNKLLRNISKKYKNGWKACLASLRIDLAELWAAQDVTTALFRKSLFSSTSIVTIRSGQQGKWYRPRAINNETRRRSRIKFGTIHSGLVGHPTTIPISKMDHSPQAKHSWIQIGLSPVLCRSLWRSSSGSSWPEVQQL